MSTLAWITAASILGGVLSVAFAALFALSARTARVPMLVSYAIGALLGAAFLELLPHAFEGATSVRSVAATVLAGIFAFFILEKLVLWRHCHDDPCEAHAPQDHHRDRASATLILWGDGFHNALDGVLIAAAFMTDTHLGIVTAIAVFAHEIPQEVGDLAILINGGMSRGRALAMNVAVSLTSVVGAAIAYFALAQAMQVLPYAIAVAASSFLYIAVADLIPGLHRRVDARASIQQVALLLLGMAVIYVSHRLAH